jgi:hypothetical protein
MFSDTVLSDFDSIIVDGKLVVSGTVSSPIHFSSIYDDTLCGIGASDEDICDTHNDGTTTAPLAGDWGHIRFNGGSDDTSIITRAVIRFSGEDWSGLVDGAIWLSNASPNIAYTAFLNNYRGIEALNGSTPNLTCNNFMDMGFPPNKQHRH